MRFTIYDLRFAARLVCLACCVLRVACWGQTALPRTMTVNPGNYKVSYPTNFWDANSNELNRVVASQQVGGVTPADLNDATNKSVTAANVQATNIVNARAQLSITRGTTNFPVESWATLTNTWRGGDIVQLGQTNTLTGRIYVNQPGLTIQGMGKNVSFIGTVTNGFVVMTNGVTFDGFTVLDVVPSGLAYANVSDGVAPTIAYLGTQPVTNLMIRNLRIEGSFCGTMFYGVGGASTGLVYATVQDCDIVNKYWAGGCAQVVGVDTNSTVIFERCTMLGDALPNGTNKQMYGSLAMRAQQGKVIFRGGTTIDAVAYTNFPSIGGAGDELWTREQIGIYHQYADLIIDGPITWGNFAGQSIQGVGRIFREGGTLTIKNSNVSSDDIVQNGTTYSPAVFFGSDAARAGTAEFEYLGTNGATIQAPYFRDMQAAALGWSATDRGLWWPLIRGFPYASNSFAMTQQTNTLLYVTNGAFLTAIWATNGVQSTNLAGTNYIVTRAANDCLILSNLNAAVRFFSIGGATFDTNLAINGGGPGIIYPDLAFNYSNNTAFSTNLPAGNYDSRYSTSGFAWVKVQRPAGGTKLVGISRYEVATAQRGRLLSVTVDVGNPITNDNQSASTLLGARSSRLTYNTNTIYVQGSGTATADGKHLWSGSAYTNVNSTARYVTNVGGNWCIQQNTTIRYTNAATGFLFGNYIIATGSAPAPVVIPEVLQVFNGSVIVTNGGLTVYNGNTVPTYQTSGTQAIVGGLTNAAGGPLGQASFSGSNNLGATSFSTNAGSVGLSVVAQGGISAALAVTANAGFVNPVFLAQTPGAGTNWNGLPTIVFTTNTTVIMPTNTPDGTMVYAFPFQLGTAGTLFCPLGAFWSLGAQTGVTNLTSGVSSPLLFMKYGTNWVRFL